MLALDEVGDHVLHGLSVLAKADGVFDFVFTMFGIEWFVITKETSVRTEVCFSLFIVTTDDCIVRSLKESVFAIMYEFGRGCSPLWWRLLMALEGATTDAVISSSSEILVAGIKSLRRPKVRHEPSSVYPIRRYCVSIGLPR